MEILVLFSPAKEQYYTEYYSSRSYINEIDKSGRIVVEKIILEELPINKKYICIRNKKPLRKRLSKLFYKIARLLDYPSPITKEKTIYPWWLK